MKIFNENGDMIGRLLEFVEDGKNGIMQKIKYIFCIHIIVENGENLPEEIIIGEE